MNYTFYHTSFYELQIEKEKEKERKRKLLNSTSFYLVK